MKMKRFAFGLAAMLIAVTASAGNNVPAATKVAPTKAVYVCQMSAREEIKEYDKPGICPTDGMPLINKKLKIKVAILLFEGAQIIDYSGPMEVFEAAGASVFTVAPSMAPVLTGQSLRVQPDFDLEHAPEADILIVPGGNYPYVIENKKLMDWIIHRSASDGTVMSVCTGAFILGKAGLLDGLSATVTAAGMSRFAKEFPKTLLVRDRRFVDTGKIVTTGGLSAGIDGALHMIERLQGSLRAQDIARGLEYEWRPDGTAGFGKLARFVLPNLGSVFQAGVSWNKLSDLGDEKNWEIAGRLELDIDLATFSDNIAKDIKEGGWSKQTSASKVSVANKGKYLQRYTKTANGQNWVMNMSLAKEQTAATYQMIVKVQRAGAI